MPSLNAIWPSPDTEAGMASTSRSFFHMTLRGDLWSDSNMQLLWTLLSYQLCSELLEGGLTGSCGSLHVSRDLCTVHLVRDVALPLW